MTELRTDFTAKDLDKALSGNTDVVYIAKYQLKEEYLNDPDKQSVWPDGTTTSHWSAAKDENGFPIVANIVVVTEEDLEDENSEYYGYDMSDLVGEQSEEFFYEGGFVANFGYFKPVGSWNLGDGHERGVVFEHQGTGRFFRKTGWYSSWDSGDWDGDMEEVEPVQVTITRYKSKSSGEVYEYPIDTSNDT